MVFRTGILSIPEYDDLAIDLILQLLRSALPAMLSVHTVGAVNQRNWIEETLRHWCDEEELDLVLTIGGTNPAPGPSAAEIVPGATVAVLERSLPGLSQAMRTHAARQSSLAWLDCGVVGIRGRSLLINLPAGAAPALLFLEAIIDLIAPLLTYLHHPENAPRLADELEIGNGDDDLADELMPDDQHAAHNPTSFPSAVVSAKQTPGGLDAAEFAAFLQRSRPPSP